MNDTDRFKLLTPWPLPLATLPAREETLLRDPRLGEGAADFRWPHSLATNVRQEQPRLYPLWRPSQSGPAGIGYRRLLLVGSDPSGCHGLAESLGRASSERRDCTSVCRYAPERLTEEVPAKARTAANSPEANAKKSAWRKGRPIHPNALAALERYRGRKPSNATRRKMSEIHGQRGTRPPWLAPPWTVEEDALLGTMPDRHVAQRTGRTLSAVQCRRALLDIDGFYRKRKRRREVKQ
jgi:hypothetical protein